MASTERLLSTEEADPGAPSAPSSRRTVASVVALSLFVAGALLELSSLLVFLLRGTEESLRPEGQAVDLAESSTSDPLLQHYEFHGPLATFEPVPGCRLPPPQPFWMVCLLNVAKASGLAYMSRISLDKDRKASALEKFEFRALILYQCVMLPLSLFASISKVFLTMGPFASSWQEYQCYSVVVATGPWLLNAGLLYAKNDILYGAFNAMNGHAEHRLEGEGIDFVWEKEEKTGMLSALTLALFFLAALPAFFTHILPGSAVFCLEAAPAAAVAVLSHQKLKKAVEAQNDSYVPEWQLLLTYGVPLALAAALGYETTIFLAVYWYDGLPWLEALNVAFLERSSWIYFANFLSKVLGSFAWSSQLVNEAL